MKRYRALKRPYKIKIFWVLAGAVILLGLFLPGIFSSAQTVRELNQKIEAKNAEWDNFRISVTDWETANYLEILWVINKVHNQNFEIPLEQIEETLDVPVLAVIPYDTKILRAVSEFIPVTEHSPKSEASIEYKKLAASLTGEKYSPPGLKRFLKWSNPKRQDINRLILYERIFKS